MNGEIVLVFLVIIGILGGSHIIATSAAFLLLIKLSILQPLLPFIEKKGIEIGLVLLILVSLAAWFQRR